MNCKVEVESIQAELKEYITKSQLKSLVIGISGGIDSTVCAALARPVCIDKSIPLIGRSLPIETNKDDEKERALKVGEAFCTDFKEFDLTRAYSAFLMNLRDEDTVPNFDPMKHKVRLGNIKARVRMIYLYEMAQRHEGLVLSTSNYTELMLGFWTLHGDVGDFGMIQNYWKTEVYDIAAYIRDCFQGMGLTDKAIAIDECIKAVPTDGLGITSSDLDQLGEDTYEKVDIILKTWLCDDIDSFHYDKFLKFEGRPKEYDEFELQRKKLESNPVVQRHLRTMFKRENPYNVRR